MTGGLTTGESGDGGADVKGVRGEIDGDAVMGKVPVDTLEENRGPGEVETGTTG
jgi:hypothetical protein